MYEIIGSITAISFMLAFVIYVQAELFWILEKGNPEPFYRTTTFGFFRAMLDSYKMAVGDFGPIVDNFEE